MRFRAHETFAIRKGWLHKGMKNIVSSPTVFIDKEVNPMEKLGLGTNMVKALRYWLQVSGLTYENQKTRMQFLTRFGELVWENDKYNARSENFISLPPFSFSWTYKNNFILSKYDSFVNSVAL